MRAATLKVAAGIGTAAVCAASAALVAGDPKPASAPLKPPTGAAPSAPPTSALSIPSSCVPRHGPTLSAAEVQVVTQLAQAKTAAARRTILQSLPADERQQVTAFVAARRAQNLCRSSGAQVNPSVGSSPDIAPVTNTYVS